MASLWKHPKSDNWFARFRGVNGKTVNRSTGIADKVEALRIALSWETEAARERAKQQPDVSPGGISDTVVRAERLARNGRLDAQAARDLINDLLNASGQETLDAITNRRWCDNWQAGKRGAVKQRSLWKYEQVSRDWLDHLKAKSEKPLESVGKADAVAFREKLVGDGLAARTINQTMKLLRGIYQEAVEEGHIGRNPFAGLQALRADDEDTTRKPFTAEEIALLIDTAEGDWKGIITVAASTGLRLMDASRLQWRNLDLTTGTLRVKTSKTGATLMLPIHPNFAAWLKDQTQGIGAAPIFPTLANKSGTGKSGLSSMFKRLMGRANVSAGIARQAGENGRGRTTSQKSFHSLRHFAATQLAAAGVRAEVARQITGHADAATHADYITADMDALRQAVNLISLPKSA